MDVLEEFPKREPERRHRQVRLPKFELRKFGGNPVAWPEFYDTFKVAIHENPDLSDIERFTYLKYLKGYVFGEAASCIHTGFATDSYELY